MIKWCQLKNKHSIKNEFNYYKFMPPRSRRADAIWVVGLSQSRYPITFLEKLSVMDESSVQVSGVFKEAIWFGPWPLFGKIKL